MKEKIKDLLVSAAMIVFGIVIIVKMDTWMFHIAGVIPVTNTIMGGIIAALGVFIFLGTLVKKK